MSQLRSDPAQAESLDDVARIDRNRRRMARRVPISRVKRCHKSGREREVCPLEPRFDYPEILDESSLLLIQRKETCCDAKAGPKNSGSVNGDTSRYAKARTATSGA